jgi:hypothetical protein
MVIEPAMRQSGTLHHFRNANSVEPALAKQLRGDLDDPVVIFLLLFLRNPHCNDPLKIKSKARAG